MPQKTPDHIMRDAGRHAYESTTELIKRLESTFGPADTELHAVIASNAMQAAFMHFYVSARLSKQNVSAQRLAEIWVETLGPQLDQIELAFNNAIMAISVPKGTA